MGEKTNGAGDYQAIARAAPSRKLKDHRFALLFLDLDRFKLANDSPGRLIRYVEPIALFPLAICIFSLSI